MSIMRVWVSHKAWTYVYIACVGQIAGANMCAE